MDDALAEELLEGTDEEPRVWTLQEKALHEARLKAKAKRRLRRTSSRDSTRESLSEGGGGEPSPDPSSSPKDKNHDRKSRMGKGRGLPKKGTHPLWYFPSISPEPSTAVRALDSSPTLSRWCRGQRRLGSPWCGL